MEVTLVIFVVLFTQCLVSPIHGQGCPPVQCPGGYVLNRMCTCVLPGITNGGATQGLSNTMAMQGLPPNTMTMQGLTNNMVMPRSNIMGQPQSRGAWGFNPAMLALTDGSEMLTNALVLDASRPKPRRTSMPSGTPGMGAFGQRSSPNMDISPFLLSNNNELVETVALHNMVGGQRGGRMDMATTLALSQGNDAVRNAMMMNSLYGKSELGTNMLLLRGGDAARDAYLINSLNRHRTDGRGSYINTLGATGALGDAYRDMLATKVVLREQNPVKQMMLSKALDIPDSTRQLIMYRATQGRSRTFF